MPIDIEPCNVEDASNMVICGEAAFVDDPMNQRVFNFHTATPQQRAEFREWRTIMAKQRMAGAGKHYFKAVDTQANGRIVGYVGIFSSGVEISAQSDVPPPAFINIEDWENLKATIDAVGANYIGGRKDLWFIQSMCVHPDYQGQGTAKRLLQRGLEEVDKAGMDIYLESTSAGLRLYQSCGFEVLGQVDLFDGEIRLDVMLRHPKQP